MVVGACFIIELTFLGGRERLDGLDVHALIDVLAADSEATAVRLIGYHVGDDVYDALTTRYGFRLPAARRDVGAALALPPARAAAGHRSIRPSTGSSSRAAAARSTPASSPTTSSTGRRSGSRRSGLHQPDDVTPRLARRRAVGPRGAPDQGGRVAVELLLLARGAAAARVPVGVPAARREPPAPAIWASRFAARSAAACR